MNKVVEVLRRERAELAEGATEVEAGFSAARELADRRRRIGEIDALLREFEQA